jgi:hypothetical protein
MIVNKQSNFVMFDRSTPNFFSHQNIMGFINYFDTFAIFRIIHRIGFYIAIIVVCARNRNNKSPTIVGRNSAVFTSFYSFIERM